MLVYNVPGRTVADMQTDTTLRLAQVPNIVGIKDATADLQRGAELLRRKPADFVVYSGDDGTALGLMDDCLSHGAFRDKHGVSVQLLADPDGEVCQRYGVLQEKEMEGRKRRAIVRSTFIIDRDGLLRHTLYGVSARGHAAEILGLIKSIGKCK